MTKRVVLWSVLGAIVVLGVGVLVVHPPAADPDGTTWAGTLRTRAGERASVLFREQPRRCRLAEYDGGLDGVRAEIASHKYDSDVIDFELDDAVSACEQGLLEPVDADTLPAGADGAPARRDFVANGIGPCWVGSVVFSQVIAYSRTRFGEARPQTLSDFFDLQRFPGPRALRRASAKFNLELALLADGVKPADVYNVLSTPEGVTRALAKLQTIRPSIVWWTRSDDAVAMLEDGRAAFAAVLNGDVFDAAMRHKPVGVIWDRQLYELDVFGIPKGDPKKARAMDFVRFATGSGPLAHVAGWVPYGPARRSSLAFVGKNPETGVAMAPYLPTEPANFATAFAIDDGWWRACRTRRRSCSVPRRDSKR